MTAAEPPHIPWHAYALLWRPRAILANLERLRAAGLVEEVPNLWQVSLGVLRMWHRLIYRTETVGTCREQPVRPTWRARLLQYRAARLPCLIVERAVAPLDFSGLVSPPARIIRHLLGAHHDGIQFVYDLEMLSVHPGKLDELHRAVVDVIERDSRRSRWLRDLVVYEGYHESLRGAVERALSDGVEVPAEAADDPDLSFSAYIRWCAQQPATPAATLRAWRSGQLALDGQLA